MLSTREVATAVWLVLFILFCLFQPTIRKSLFEVFRSFFLSRPLLTVCLAAVLYVCGEIVLLAKLGVWTTSQLKDTLLWIPFGALTVLFAQIGKYEGRGLIKGLLADTVRFWVIVEFLTSAYTYPIYIEIITVPASTFLIMLIAVASLDERHRPALGLLNAIQAILGMVVIYTTGRAAWADIRHLASFNTARALMLEPLLTFLYIPFLYGFLLFNAYEQLFVRLDLGSRKSPEFTFHAKRLLLRALGVSVASVRDFTRAHGSTLMTTTTRNELSELLARRSSEETPNERD